MAGRAVRTDRDYAGWLVGAILLVVLVGFSRSFFLRPLFGGAPEWAAPEPIFYLHGFVFTGWFLLLGVQTWLIRSRSAALHRRIGYWGAALGAAIVLLGVYSSLKAANRPTGFFGVPFPPDVFLAVPLLGVALFGAFLTLALARRNQAASHKRLMILASISLLGAPIGRLPLMMPVLPFFLDAIVYTLFFAAMAAWDYDTRRRLTPETLWGGLAIIALNIAALPLAQSEPWRSTAIWMMGLVGLP